MRRNHLASLAGSLLLAGVLSGCGAVTTAQSQPERQLPTAPPAPTPASLAGPAIPAAPALPQLAGLGPEVLRDEFDAGLAAWTAKDIVSLPVSEPAVWEAAAGRLDQITGPEGLAAMSPVTLVRGDGLGADYTVQAVAQSRGNEAMGVVARAGDQGFYYLSVRSADARGTKAYLAKYDAASDQFTTLARLETGGWALNEWTALALRVEGSNLTGYVNGQAVLEAKDDSFSSGKAGVYGYGVGDLSFDHFVVNANN
ncbi:MAG TPA: hypothetical protein VGE07_07435 [Herpetosiphonaceae bacterium]